MIDGQRQSHLLGMHNECLYLLRRWPGVRTVFRNERDMPLGSACAVNDVISRARHSHEVRNSLNNESRIGPPFERSRPGLGKDIASTSAEADRAMIGSRQHQANSRTPREFFAKSRKTLFERVESQRLLGVQNVKE